ncbi:hypothetical protein ACFCYI_06245 [Streptomyces sp. NPDC056257]|uniref:hypothetical protein n=1 Tax=Streptomyces sp. NPDC056257 TaxID=3345765 RepID=UPI0035E06356
MYAEGRQQGTSPTPVSADRMVRLLESLLPQGEFSEQKGHGLGDEVTPSPSAELLFDQGHRAAKVTVALSRFSVPAPPQFLDCPDTAYHPYSQCTRTVMPGGAILVQDRSPKDQDRPAGNELLTVLITHEDGRQVFASATAAPDDGGEATSATLPLTLEQLTAVAVSPSWKRVLAVMPAPSEGPRTESVPRMTGQQISHVIAKLLPSGLSTASEGGSVGFGHIVVNDGRGESLVAANVQRWKPEDPSMRKLFERADTLPDGTRLSVRQGPASGGDGAIAWTVDTFRKDGLRVVITAVNARAFRLPAGRSEPALNTEQLRQMALDAAWEEPSR